MQDNRLELYQIDTEGYLIFGGEILIEPIDYDEDEKPIYKIPEGYTDIPLPTDERGWQLPFYRPRLVDGQWIETMSEEEIKELQKPPEPTKQEAMEQEIAYLWYEIMRLEGIKDVV
jgi:hypothetical protein